MRFETKRYLSGKQYICIFDADLPQFDPNSFVEKQIDENRTVFVGKTGIFYNILISDKLGIQDGQDAEINGKTRRNLKRINPGWFNKNSENLQVVPVVFDGGLGGFVGLISLEEMTKHFTFKKNEGNTFVYWEAVDEVQADESSV